MKKAVFLLFAALLYSSCSSVIEEDLRSKLEDLSERVLTLEELCSRANTNIASVQTILDAVSKNNYISSVTPVTQEVVGGVKLQ